jgi:raffinose/stachyose/melibiose transport system permease protein
MSKASKARDNAFSAAFLAPSFILYTSLVILMIGMALYYTMTNWKGVGPKNWIWFKNYITLFTKDRDYWTVTKNSFILVALAILIQNPLGLLLAYLVSHVKIGYRAFRAAIFLPVVIPMASTGLLFTLFLSGDTGVFNVILSSLGLGALQRMWLSDPKVAIFAVALPQVWQYLGIHFIIYLAAMQSIPVEILESARIDGAPGRKVMMRIIIPLMFDVLLIGIVLNVTGSLKAFDMSWIMTWGGPGIASAYISVLMYRYAIKGFDFAYGTTVAMTILLYSLIFTVGFRRIFRKSPTD